MPRFRPIYIFESELADYGLPSTADVPSIMSLVRGASTLIDEHCGRTDGNGNGSLVYTTYLERILLQSRGRNITRVTFKPLAIVSGTVVSDLQASGASGSFNYFDTGVQANTVVKPDGSTSCFLGASGRYGYARRGDSYIYPDLNYGINPLMIAAFFGGPPNFVPIDCTMIDFDPATGEIWIPAGIYLSQYTEILVKYNSGFDPRDIHPVIKDSCADIVRNYLAKGGTSGIRALASAASVSVQMNENLIDTNIDQRLSQFVNIMAY